jgi:hypothetical protein
MATEPEAFAGREKEAIMSAVLLVIDLTKEG